MTWLSYQIEESIWTAGGNKYLAFLFEYDSWLLNYQIPFLSLVSVLTHSPNIISLFLTHTHIHTQVVSRTRRLSPVSLPPPVSLTNSRRSVRSFTDADKPAHSLRPWVKLMPFLLCSKPRCFHKPPASVTWTQAPVGFLPKGHRGEDDKQLAHTRLSLWMPVCLHLSLLVSYPAFAQRSADSLACLSELADSSFHCIEASVLIFISAYYTHTHRRVRTHTHQHVYVWPRSLLNEKQKWMNK